MLWEWEINFLRRDRISQGFWRLTSDDDYHLDIHLFSINSTRVNGVGEDPIIRVAPAPLHSSSVSRWQGDTRKPSYIAFRMKGLKSILWVSVILLMDMDGYFAMIQDLYCGVDNCYEVLKVTRESSKSEIAKAYRSLAKLYHPDRHMNPDDKAEAEETFKTVATAYEVLKDEESRSDYDYMLDHPEEYYRHYYHYYKRKMSPKVDVRIVVAVFITLLSIFQYYAASFRWSSGISYLVLQPKYRKMALEVAEEEGLLKDVKKMKKRNKEEIRAEEERIIRSILENKMEIRGGYAKPKVTDVVFFQLLLLPRTIYRYGSWYASWIYRFNINNETYGTEEKLYLIRKLMKLSEIQFEAVPEEEKQDFLDKELWIKQNFMEWKTAMEEERKRKNAESARYKSYRRYMKKHGTGRMTFDDS